MTRCVCGRDSRPGEVECSLCGRELPVDGPGTPPPPPARPPGRTTTSVNPLVVVGVVVAVAVLVLVGYLALAPGGSTARGTGSSSGTGRSSEPEPPTTAPPTSDEDADGPTDAPTQESTQEPTQEPTGEQVVLPAGAARCTATFHDDAATLQHSARGNGVTTCPFAEQVRRVYLDEGGADGPVRIRAHSPVTGRTYTMTCEDTSPVVCTGGRDAVVYLY